MSQEERREYVVQAHEGWAVLIERTGVDGIVEEFSKDPVVAWRVVSEGEVDKALSWSEPICVDGSHADTAGVLLRPDGLAMSPGHRWWDSEQEYLKELQEEQRARKAKAA